MYQGCTIKINSQSTISIGMKRKLQADGKRRKLLYFIFFLRRDSKLKFFKLENKTIFIMRKNFFPHFMLNEMKNITL